MMKEENKKKLDRADLETAAGGFEGQYGYVDTYYCSCGTPQAINQYVYSGQYSYTCRCGKKVTVYF